MQLILAFALCFAGVVPSSATPSTNVFLVSHTYEAKIRLNGKVSTTQVQASDAGHAKKLVQAQFPNATVLSVKRLE